MPSRAAPPETAGLIQTRDIANRRDYVQPARTQSAEDGVGKARPGLCGYQMATPGATVLPGAPGAAGAPGAKGDTGATGHKARKGEAGVARVRRVRRVSPAPATGPSPSQFRNFTVTAGPDNAPCVLARAASQDTLAITYEATKRQPARPLPVHEPNLPERSAASPPNVPASSATTPRTNIASQYPFTPGFAVPAGTALYAVGSGFVNGYVTS